MDLTKPDRIAIWTEDGRDDRAAEVLLTGTADAARVELTAPGSAPTYVALRWSTPVPSGTRVLGDHWERGYGDLEWRGIVPERVLPWYALAHDESDERTLGYGVETGCRTFASWRVDERGITLVLDVRCGGRGVRLGDRVLHAATVRVLASEVEETPFAFASRFCRALCPMPRLPSTPAYGGNDWYFRYGAITADTVRRDAALIRELSPEGPALPFFTIDAGWFPARGCAGGPYDRGNADFADMPGLASWMRDQGVRPGIWIRPLLTTEDVPAAWRLFEGHPLGGGDGVYLDPSVPEVLARVRADIGRLSAWGYELIKHDFTTFDLTGRWGFQMGPQVTPDGWAFADRGVTTAEVILALYGAIREAAGDALLLGCNTIGHLGAGLFELQRTGDDTSGRDWERTRKMGVNTLAFRMPQHGAFFAADPDCVGLTHDVPWRMNHQWLDAVARSGAALFVSADPDAVGPDQRTALREAFARAALPQPAGEPLDWLETTCPRRWRLSDGAAEYDWVEFAGPVFGCP